jgi:HSF-type DNA-binding
MLITMYIEKMERSSSSVAGKPPLQWVNSGSDEEIEHIIVFSDHDRFATKVLPLFAFPPTSFKSFVRKMYRWGFRRTQPNGDGDANDPRAFSCENFRRGNFLRLTRMVSVDSRVKKPGRGATARLASPVSSAAARPRSTPSPSSNVHGGDDGANLCIGRKRGHDAITTDTTLVGESASVAQSHVKDPGAQYADRVSRIADLGNLRSQSPTTLESNPTRVADRAVSAEQRFGNGRNRPLHFDTAQSMIAANMIHSGGHEPQIPLSFVQAAILSANNASAPTRSTELYGAPQQRPEQIGQPGVSSHDFFRLHREMRPGPLPDGLARVFPPLEPTLPSQPATSAFQSLAARQYSNSLGDNRSLPLYISSQANFPFSNRLLSVDTGPSLSTALPLPPMSNNASSGFQSAASIHPQRRLDIDALQRAETLQAAQNRPSQHFALNNALALTNPVGPIPPATESRLLEVLARARTANDTFTASNIRQQQQQLIPAWQQQLATGARTDALLAQPLLSVAQPLQQTNDAVLLQAITSMTREQLQAYFHARQAG